MLENLKPLTKREFWTNDRLLPMVMLTIILTLICLLGVFSICEGLYSGRFSLISCGIASSLLSLVILTLVGWVSESIVNNR